MTTAEFHTEGRRITGFTVRGHSGYAPEGEDIVCAAVTSAVRLVECAVNDVLGLEASVKVRQKDASITLKLPANLGQTRAPARPFWPPSWSTLSSWRRNIPIILPFWRCNTC